MALHIDKLVDVPTNKCHSCGYQLQPGCEVGHYKVVHYFLLKEIAKREAKAAAMKPEQFVDTGILDALAREGFFKQLQAAN